MTLDLSLLDNSPRLLFSIPMAPIQGQRFQPTGFPSLGAATYHGAKGLSVLVESTQSMANRLEATAWDEASQQLHPDFDGISHVTVLRDGEFLTDTILESHRLNSPYILESKDKTFMDQLKGELGVLAEGPVDRRKLAETLLKYDVGSLLHGVFLAKKDLAGGRLRVARAISAFIEADHAQIAASGGVKVDHVDPQGDAKKGFGHVPFARDEFTAEAITLYVNIDLAQIRGYGLDADATKLLIVMAMYKVRRLLDGELRLRTACDLVLRDDGPVLADRPDSFTLPSLDELRAALRESIDAVASRMSASETNYKA